MSEQAVLYDAPGPRTRRISVIASIVAAVVVLAVAYFLVYRPLADKGEFSMERWGPLIDPNNPSFEQLWRLLGSGLRATILAAALSIVASVVIGTALAILRVQLKALRKRRFGSMAPVGQYGLRGLSRVLSALTRVYVEVGRGTPVVITVVFVWLGFESAGADLDLIWYLVIGLTIYNSIVIGEILRSGMEGVLGGQSEAASAIGLSSFQATRMILLPQAFRVMLPALISQIVVILKDTSLGFIIGYEELLRTANIAKEVLGNPIQMYAVVGIIYIAMNYGLSKLAVYLQRRLARGRKTGGVTVADPQTVAVRGDTATGAGAV